MKSRDDLISVLNLGWETARRVWRLLSPDVEFTIDSVGTTGRDMDQVAYDLRRLGHGKPARLAFSVAFILNGLAGGTIEFDRDLAEKASQIVSILAEMLLELEATSQITAQEPADIVELLQTRWGLVIWTEDHASSALPRPHFRTESPLKQAADEVLTSVASISDELIQASQSLMLRAGNDAECPYLPSLSRIHQLGLSIRDRVASHAPGSSSTPGLVSTIQANRIQAESEGGALEVLTINSPNEPAILQNEPDTPGPTVPSPNFIEGFAGHVPAVLIIDESPFFRMLLTSAIESAGYAPQAFTSLLEARQSDSVVDCDLVVCTAAQVAGDEARLDWLPNGCAALIVLMSKPVDLTNYNSTQTHHVHRTDVAGLLALVKSILGPGRRSIRRSA